MFRRYDITSMDDKAEALRRASAYAKTRAAVLERCRIPRANWQRYGHAAKKSQVL
jgi:hypothetical protein